MKPGDRILKPPVEWEKSTGIKVLDPDGWREDEKSYADPIDLPEFLRRCGPSTVRIADDAEWG